MIRWKEFGTNGIDPNTSFIGPLLRMNGKHPLPVTIYKSVESSKSQWLPRTRALVLIIIAIMILPKKIFLLCIYLWCLNEFCKVFSTCVNLGSRKRFVAILDCFTIGTSLVSMFLKERFRAT